MGPVTDDRSQLMHAVWQLFRDREAACRPFGPPGGRRVPDREVRDARPPAEAAAVLESHPALDDATRVASPRPEPDGGRFVLVPRRDDGREHLARFLVAVPGECVGRVRRMLDTCTQTLQHRDERLVRGLVVLTRHVVVSGLHSVSPRELAEDGGLVAHASQADHVTRPVDNGSSTDAWCGTTRIPNAVPLGASAPSTRIS